MKKQSFPGGALKMRWIEEPKSPNSEISAKPVSLDISSGSNNNAMFDKDVSQFVCPMFGQIKRSMASTNTDDR